MTNERKAALLKILLPDEDTAKKTLAMTPAEVVRYLADHGETATLDEVTELGADVSALAEKIKAAMDANGGELSEEMLAEVAGGASVATVVEGVLGTLAGIVGCGLIVAGIFGCW